MTATLRTLIVGDDPESTGLLKDLLGASATVHVVGEFARLSPALHEGPARRPDLVIVELPAGCYRITGNLSVPTAVTLAGVGFTPPPSGATPDKLAGSWLPVDPCSLYAPAITLAYSAATALDLGMWHEQPAPGACCGG